MSDYIIAMQDEMDKLGAERDELRALLAAARDQLLGYTSEYWDTDPGMTWKTGAYAKDNPAYAWLVSVEKVLDDALLAKGAGDGDV